MELLNNREIATLVWLSIGLCWCLRDQKLRASLKRVIEAAIAKPLLKIYALMFTYIFGMLYVLHEIDLWDFEQTKSTMIWTFSVALVSLFRHKEIQEDPEYFKKSLRDNFNLVVIIEFVVAFYSFHLVAELIIIPVAALLVAVHTYSGFHEKYKPVEKFFDKVFVVLGICILIYAGHNIVIGLAEFATMKTLTDFYTPPVLSFLLLPSVYILSIYSSYQRAFLQIGHNATELKILGYAKWRSINAFHFRTRLMERWAHSTFFNQLETKQDVIKTISRMNEIAAYEKNPEPVQFEKGWCPYEAKDFLKDFGLETRHYTGIDDGEWFANSSYLDIDDRFMANCVAYYVSGKRKAAKNLKLKLTVNKPEQEEEAISKFVGLSNELLFKALGTHMVNDLETALREGHEAKGEFHGKSIIITREDWANSDSGQFSLEFLIQSP